MIAARLSPGPISESSPSHLPLQREAAEYPTLSAEILRFLVAREISVAALYTTLPARGPPTPWKNAPHATPAERTAYLTTRLRGRPEREIAGEDRADVEREREGRTHDYSRKKGLEAWEGAHSSSRSAQGITFSSPDVTSMGSIA